MVYLSSVVEDSFARPEGEGYVVRLYSYALFGCGPHVTSAVDYYVSHAGEFERRAQEAVFKDPKMDNLCVD